MPLMPPHAKQDSGDLTKDGNQSADALSFVENLLIQICSHGRSRRKKQLFRIWSDAMGNSEPACKIEI
jgi:hypothetical protein